MDSTAVITKQIRAFRLFGMLPAKSPSYLYSLWGVIVFFLAGIGLVSIQSLSVFYVQSTNELVEELLLLCTTAHIAIKIILFNSHRQHLFEILDILKTADKEVENQDDINTMKSVYAYCHGVTILFVYGYIGCLPALLLQLIFLDRTQCTWKSTALVPYDFAQKPEIYYSLLAFQAIGNTLNCVTAWALDTFCFVIISLLCGHIEVLSLHLKKIGTERRSGNRSNQTQLLKHLKHYNLLTEYVFSMK